MTDFVVEWVQNLLEGLRAQVDEETRARVLAGCSHACTAPWADQAREIRQRAPAANEAALLTAFCAVLPGGGPHVQVEDDTIFWSFAPGDCPCPIGQLTKNPEICLCGKSHVQGMLEPLLGRPLTVQLIRSCLRGDKECAYIIR